MALLPFSLPYCDISSEKGELEESFWKRDILVRALEGAGEDEADAKEDLDKEQSEALIKLFALACKTGSESRALDVCKYVF